jgi:hypothetical protein
MLYAEWRYAIEDVYSEWLKSYYRGCKSVQITGVYIYPYMV